MKITAYRPQEDIPDQSGRVILLTGGTAGIGKEFLLQIAAHNPAHLFFTGRNTKSADGVVAQLKEAAPSVSVTFLQCDLASVETVRRAADQFLAESQRLDVLIANAGIMAVPPSLTADGHEVQFGTNFFGHAALIHLLLPTMLATAEIPGADVRLIMTASQAYQLHPFGGIRFETVNTAQENMNRWVRYGQAKLAMLLWARELARRYPQIQSVAVHPGTIRTGLMENLDLTGKLLTYYPSLILGNMITPTQGAYNSLWVATSKSGLESGGYYMPVGVKADPWRRGSDDELAGKLWDWTMEELRRVGVSVSD